MATKRIPYLNKFSGQVVVVTKQHAKKLNEDWSEIRFVTNEAGNPVMRLELSGATVDVSENDQQPEVSNGI